jgi:hypothetical protein
MPPTSPITPKDDKFSQLIVMINELKNSQSKIISAINSCRESIKLQDTKLTSFDSKFDLLFSQISSVIEENKSLKLRIELLESKPSSFEKSQSDNHSVTQESLFSEFMDRQSRARNIILFNVPDHSTSADQQNDCSLVNEIFNVISVPTKPICSSIGKAFK